MGMCISWKSSSTAGVEADQGEAFKGELHCCCFDLESENGNVEMGASIDEDVE